MNASLVYDAILLVIVLFFFLRGYHTGAMGMVMLLLGWILSAVLIMSFSQPVAEQIYDNVVEPRVLSAVEQAVPGGMSSVMGLGADTMGSVQTILDALGGPLGGQVVNQEALQSIQETLRSGSTDLAGGITETVFRPLFVGILRWVVALVILFFILFIFRGLTNGMMRRSRSLMGQANRLIGGVLGAVVGAGAGYLYAVALYGAAKFITLPWLSRELVENTYLVKLYL